MFTLDDLLLQHWSSLFRFLQVIVHLEPQFVQFIKRHQQLHARVYYKRGHIEIGHHCRQGVYLKGQYFS